MRKVSFIAVTTGIEYPTYAEARKVTKYVETRLSGDFDPFETEYVEQYGFGTKAEKDLTNFWKNYLTMR